MRSLFIINVYAKIMKHIHDYDIERRKCLSKNTNKYTSCIRILWDTVDGSGDEQRPSNVDVRILTKYAGGYCWMVK